VVELRSNAKLLTRFKRLAPAYTAPAQKQTRLNEPPSSAPTVPAKSPERTEPKEAANGNGAKVAPSGECNGNSFSQLSKDTLVKALEKTRWVQAKATRIPDLTPRQVGYALKKHGIETKHY
jgi:Nif-specific regulatory protein